MFLERVSLQKYTSIPALSMKLPVIPYTAWFSSNIPIMEETPVGPVTEVGISWDLPLLLGTRHQAPGPKMTSLSPRVLLHAWEDARAEPETAEM